MAEGTKKPDEFTKQERKLIEYIRKVGFGQMLITIRDGKPCRIEEIRKSIPIE